MLSELLSQLLVAYTIEFDNEFERLMPHRTATLGPGGPSPARSPALSPAGGPIRRVWLVSMAMWSNLMRYLPPEGLPKRQVEGLPANLSGLERWGYVVVEPPAGAGRAADRLVRPTEAGLWAQACWRGLAGVVDGRWEQRFGAAAIAELRESLRGIAGQVGAGAGGMPLYLPMVVNSDGLRSRYRDLRDLGLPTLDVAELDLSALLSAVLLAFTLEYEAVVRLPLPICANTLRVMEDAGVRQAELALLAGVSREAVSMSVGFLERNGYVEVGADPAGAGAGAGAGGRGKFVRLTERGVRARDGRARLAARIELGWEDRFGAGEVERLRGVLRELVTRRSDDGRPTLAIGLEPGPGSGGWRAHGVYRAQTRAMLADPAAALPRHPMVLHRGGYPDGS